MVVINKKAEAILQAAEKLDDLRTCTIDDLESIKGIGFKTSRIFLTSSREGVRHAVLDTHLLRWMRDQGIQNIPKITPGNRSKYLTIEALWLTMVPDGKTPAEFDLEIWNEYSRNARTKR